VSPSGTRGAKSSSSRGSSSSRRVLSSEGTGSDSPGGMRPSRKPAPLQFLQARQILDGVQVEVAQEGRRRAVSYRAARRPPAAAQPDPARLEQASSVPFRGRDAGSPRSRRRVTGW
jgi:hypothetical protein